MSGAILLVVMMFPDKLPITVQMNLDPTCSYDEQLDEAAGAAIVKIHEELRGE